MTMADKLLPPSAPRHCSDVEAADPVLVHCFAILLRTLNFVEKRSLKHPKSPAAYEASVPSKQHPLVSFIQKWAVLSNLVRVQDCFPTSMKCSPY